MNRRFSAHCDRFVGSEYPLLAGALVAGAHRYHGLQTFSARALFVVGQGLDGDVVAFSDFAQGADRGLLL